MQTRILLVFVLSATFSVAMAKPPGIRAIAVSPDGKLLAACASNGVSAGEVAVWDGKTGALKFVHREQAGIPRLAFSPDSKRLALARFANDGHVLDAQTGKEIGVLRGHTNHVRCVTFTPDGRRIITGSYDRTLRIWDAESYRLLHTIEDAGGPKLCDVEVSPNGKLLAVADGADFVFRLFDLEKRKELFATERMGSFVPDVSFSPDSKTVGVACWVNDCRLYDVGRQQLKFGFEVGSSDWTDFSPDGNLFAIAGGTTLYVFSFGAADQRTEKRIRDLIRSFESDDYQVRESATKRLFELGSVSEPFLARAMSSDIPEVRIRARRIRDRLMTKEGAVLLELDDEAECGVFSDDGKQLFTGDKGGNIVVWNVGEWTRVRTMTIPAPAGR